VRPALAFENVSFDYAGRPALAGVSFTIAPGESVALLGRNGAGKSTLLRLVTGLLHPVAGTVRVGDWDAAARRPDELARRVGSLFQHADQQLFARTVAEDVAFGPRVTGIPAPEIDARVQRAMESLGLLDVAAEHPYDLPLPWRKLAALAGALALEPMLLVLDEPTAGLDRRARARVAEALTTRAEGGTALLVVTHDLGFAAETLQRALVLEQGRLARDAPLGPLLAEARRLEELGLVAPPLARLSQALGLPGGPVREAEVARALVQRCST
jgi:energy-coupling factor transporter ATP-binding protein EcfA2